MTKSVAVVNTMLLSILCLCFAISSCIEKQMQVPSDRPNIVLIIADDLGYSDLGCFGSEIATPNIDALASQGQIFTNFYTAATCSPTRAMLLSGTDNHLAGLGNMAERVPAIVQQVGQPGYEGYLNDRVVSIAKLIRDQGYHTYIAGKWHLGLTPDQSPQSKGFERSFTLLDAYANHYQPDNRYTSFWQDDGYTGYPNGEYSTKVYTDKLIEFIEDDLEDTDPFFLMASYTSPHWPLQAPPENIEMYQAKYDFGYDSLRMLRFQGLKKKGIISSNATLPELPAVKGNLYEISNLPLLPWTSLSSYQQKIEARKMEIYAGMVDNLDEHVGRLMDYLKEIGKFENTLFIFFSDNGAAVLDFNYTPPESEEYQSMGTYSSFVAYGPPWAHASSAAYRFYKGYASEGGIRSPMIVKMPFQKDTGAVVPAFTTVMDIAPTLLEIAGGRYPASYENRPLTPYKGKSLLPLLHGESNRVHMEDYVMGWELFGRGALRQGDWKITLIEPPFGMGRFELFNLREDPGESHDLSEKYPDIYQEMLKHWENYIQENGVILENR
ncbi:MAG: arylsulfatase [Cyclobacteriaceae bacterium]|nr:arylsulfatase [Cyclobacteriaceae bacterium]